MRELPPQLIDLARQQLGVLAVRQLADVGLRRRDIDRRVTRGSWQRVSDGVIATQLAPLSRQANLRAAALHYEHCALGGSSALEVLGLPEPNDSVIHIIGMPAGRVAPMPGCVVHTSKEFQIARSSPDCVDAVDAVVQTLRWARSDRQGVFQAIWAIQQGVVTLEQLQEAFRDLKPSPGTAIARKRFRLIEPGVHSMHEFDFSRQCAQRGFPPPSRQRQRQDSTGTTRYTDVEFRINSQTLIVEIDGKQHLDPQTWIEDTWRANELTNSTSKLLRVPALALRLNPEPFFQQLRQRLQAMALSGPTSDRPFQVA